MRIDKNSSDFERAKKLSKIDLILSAFFFSFVLIINYSIYDGDFGFFNLIADSTTQLFIAFIFAYPVLYFLLKGKKEEIYIRHIVLIVYLIIFVGWHTIFAGSKFESFQKILGLPQASKSSITKNHGHGEGSREFEFPIDNGPKNR